MTSQTAAYALHATVFLASVERAEPVSVGELAEALGAPRNTLSKILGALARGGVLTSLRGPAGGFRLACQPQELELARVVGLFDPLPGRRCLLGRGECGDTDPCMAHALWKEVAQHVDEFFRCTTVADLLAASAGAPVSDGVVEDLNRAGERPMSGGRRDTRRKEAKHG